MLFFCTRYVLINQDSHSNINVPVNDDDIGLYVKNKLTRKDVLLSNRLLSKP